MSTPDAGPALFAGLIDLASAAHGGRAIIASDDFFASMANLVAAAPPAFDPNAYTDRGKLMDGWESRRRRTPGHDWCIIELGLPGVVRGLDIDTAFFLGNHPPFAAVDACHAPGADAETLRDRTAWTPLVAEVPLRRGSHNLVAVADERTWTHLRLHMIPDGGIARLRVYGTPRVLAAHAITDATDATAEIDLAALAHGGRAIACSDMFFSPMDNLLKAGESTFMGDGWETRRSRPPGDDWVIIALGRPGRVREVIAETHHFKGNYPDRCALDGLYWPGAPASMLINHADWRPITATTRLSAHARHAIPVHDASPLTHLRLRIAPDGGISRLRVLGTPTDDRPADATFDAILDAINVMPDAALVEALTRCCGSRRWVEGMITARPYHSRTHLLGEAARVWWRLGDGDWLEAFEHHPAIGADVAALRAKFAATADWSASEQSGVAGADDDTLEALAAANRVYHKRFGHIFIVCATGKSAVEMLDLLRARLDNPPAAELRIAAGEQARITALRLAKLEKPQ